MAEDVRVRMYAIQENELDLLRALTTFLDDEVHFVEQYLEVLKEAKAAWIDRCVSIFVLQAHTLKPRNSIKRNFESDGFGQKTTTSTAARVRLSFWLSTFNEVSVNAPLWLIESCVALEELMSEYPKTMSMIAAALITIGAIPALPAVSAGAAGAVLASGAAHTIGSVAVALGTMLAAQSQMQNEKSNTSKG